MPRISKKWLHSFSFLLSLNSKIIFGFSIKFVYFCSASKARAFVSINQHKHCNRQLVKGTNFHIELCALFSLTELRGYKANRTRRFGLRSNGALYSFGENNNVKLYLTFRPRESFKIQKQNRNSENLTQLKRDIIRMSINTIRLSADALIVSVDVIRKSQNFLIVFFDEKGKI